MLNLPDKETYDCNSLSFHECTFPYGVIYCTSEITFFILAPLHYLYPIHFCCIVKNDSVNFQNCALRLTYAINCNIFFGVVIKNSLFVQKIASRLNSTINFL